MEKDINKHGFLLVNKPAGPTSHDIIDQLRKITGIRKIGHAGTLDPFASGLLIVAIGREATRQISQFVKLDKEYVATLYLGAISDTYDKTGKIKKLEVTCLPARQGSMKGEVEIKKVLGFFVGEQLQTPPMYSAKKVGGRKLYELARRGVEIERKPSSIKIYSIEQLSYDWPLLEIKIKCSGGTYIRSLAHDIGAKLGCGAYLEKLKRTAIGQYKLKDSVEPESLSPGNWQTKLFPARLR